MYIVQNAPWGFYGNNIVLLLLTYRLHSYKVILIGNWDEGRNRSSKKSKPEDVALNNNRTGLYSKMNQFLEFFPVVASSLTK